MAITLVQQTAFSYWAAGPSNPSHVSFATSPTVGNVVVVIQVGGTPYFPPVDDVGNVFNAAAYDQINNPALVGRENDVIFYSIITQPGETVIGVGSYYVDTWLMAMEFSGIDTLIPVQWNAKIPSTPSSAITEFPIPTGGSQSNGICSGPDGDLWFTEYRPFANNIGKCTTSGVITEFPIPTASSNPTGICSGPDGNLWFTEYGTNKIGKCTTSGVITEYTIPTSGSKPDGICLGPDGNLWFCEEIGNKIGKVTTSGSFTEYTIPTASSAPLGICTGPDGNLWFCEANTNKIGKVTTSGSFTEYTIPTASSNPVAICLGPDGNLWFTEESANQIGKCTTSGVITEFPIPTIGSEPAVICTGSDGNLWFTEENGNNIGKCTTSGVITEFPIPTASSVPVGICSGPDGDLWFTEDSANNIGKCITSGQTPPVSPVITPNVTGQLLISVCSLANAVNSPWTLAGQTHSMAVAYYLNPPVSPQQAIFTPVGSGFFYSVGALFNEAGHAIQLAPIKLVQRVSKFGPPVTLSQPSTAGNLLVFIDYNVGPGTVSGNIGPNWTAVSGPTVPSMWYLLDCPAGITTVYGGGAYSQQIVIMEFSGAGTFVNSGYISGSGEIMSPVAIPTQVNQLLIAAAWGNASFAMGAASPWTFTGYVQYGSEQGITAAFYSNPPLLSQRADLMGNGDYYSAVFIFSPPGPDLFISLSDTQATSDSLNTFEGVGLTLSDSESTSESFLIQNTTARIVSTPVVETLIQRLLPAFVKSYFRIEE